MREDGFELHDAACPLVQRVHKALAKLVAEGRYPVVIGQTGHVEVRGLVGDLLEYAIVQCEEDIDQLACRSRLGIVAQTTQPIERVIALVQFMKFLPFFGFGQVRAGLALESPRGFLQFQRLAGACFWKGQEEAAVAEVAGRREEVVAVA